VPKGPFSASNPEIAATPVALSKRKWVADAPRGRLTPEERSEMAKKAALAGGRS
jgi:hypothetical protein